MPGQSSSRPASSIVDATIMSRSPSVLTTEVDGETVMMSIKQGRYFGLDDIGSDICKRIESPCSFATLIEGLAADYEADRATIRTDVQNLLGHMVARCRAAHLIPSGLLHLSSAGLSDFGCTLSEKMTVPAGGNKWEWFKRYGRTKYPNSPPHTSTSVYCLRIWLNRAFTAAGASGWLLFTKPIT